MGPTSLKDLLVRKTLTFLRGIMDDERMKRALKLKGDKFILNQLVP